MNLTELQNELLTGESGTTFTWSPSNPTFQPAPWTDVTAFVASTLAGNQLVVTGFTKSVTTAVVYTGQVAALFAQQDPTFQQIAVTVNAIFWLDGSGNPQLAIEVASLTSAWTLPQSIGGLGNSVLDTVTFTAPAFVLSSANGTNPVNGAVLVEGVTFNGTVRMSGVFLPAAPLLAQPDAMLLSGQIAIAPNAIPTMLLSARSLQNTPMPPFPFSFGIGIELTSRVLQRRESSTLIVDVQLIEATLAGIIYLGSGPGAIAIPVHMDLLAEDATFLTFEIVGVSVPIPSWSALQPLTGVADLGSYIPPAVPPSGALVLNRLAIVVDTSPEAESVVQSLNVDIALNPASPWVIIPNGVLSIANLGVNFTLQGLGIEDVSSSIPTLQLYGTFRFGTPDDPVDYGLTVEVPDLVVNGRLVNATTIPLSLLIEQFIGRVTGVHWKLPDMNVTQLDLMAAPLQRIYSIEAEIDFGWTLALQYVSFTFETLSFGATYDSATLSGNITGNFSIVTVSPPSAIALYATAATPGDGSWFLEAGSLPGSSINLTAILKLLLSPVLDPTSYDLPSLSITGLKMGITFSADDAGNTTVTAWAFAAQTDGFWEFSIAGFEFAIFASADLAGTLVSGTWQTRGVLRGALMIGNFQVTAMYEFTPTNWALTFQLLYKGKGITARIYQKQIGSTTNTLLQISIGDLSFGDIVEYLVNLARPGDDFTLPAPWSVLYQISFSGLSLLVNLTTREVGIRYERVFDFVFVEIDAIELWNRTNASGQSSVQISIEGKFLGVDYTSDPLQWDLLDEKPPAVPGAGEKLIDVRYLALGQRIGVPAAANANTITEALTALRAAMKPASPNSNPLLQPSGSSLQFDSSSAILFAADFSILGDFITIGAVLWDPNLYGMFIALGGDRAGSMAGLRFELLYKKVTDNIGVFKIELRLPEAFRQLEFGEVSITLGVVKVDIYTNGNFRVDLGFPKGGDFSDSFALQVFPFLGFGGMYFALLNGQTSTTVPRISNGTFDPVIEAGLGLSVGVGKEINHGPLSAGLSITVFAVIEGTVAWFNPTSDETPKAMFFRLEGTAGIVGKLYGSVDFYVVKVSVSVVARATVAFVVESYEPIFIELSVEVSVDAEIKILFVTISFSFSLKLQESFTIGSRSTPPWQIASGGNNDVQRARLRLPAQRRAARLAAKRRRARAVAAHPGKRRRMNRTSRIALSTEDSYATLNWSNNVVFGGSKETVVLLAVPTFTVAVPSTLYPTPQPPPDPDNPQVEGVVLLTAANTIAPSAKTAEEARVVRFDHLGVEDASSVPFGILTEATLRWAIAALLGTGATDVTLVDLLEIQRAMELDPNTEPVGFAYTSITAFLSANLVFQIAPPPTSGNETGGTIFPMIPELSMTAPGIATPVNFSTNVMADQAWVDFVQTYFQQIAVDVLADVASDPYQSAAEMAKPRRSPRALGIEDDDPTQSIATVVFRDWFLVLTKSVVQAAIDTMEQWQYAVQSGDSLQHIAGLFPKEELTLVATRGDTLESIAALYGMGVEDLRARSGLAGDAVLRAGQALAVTDGVSPASIAVANQALTILNPATTLTIAGVLVQVQSGDTLTAVGAPFGVTNAGTLGTENADNDALLLAGATLQVPSFTHAAIAGDNLDFLAAFYYARNGQIDDADDQYAWYVQAVFELNPSMNFSVPFAGGVSITVPTGFQVEKSSTQTYTTRPGDTQAWIAGYFFLVQLHASDLLEPLETAIQNANLGVNFNDLTPGQAIVIPVIAHTIAAGETLSGIASDFSLQGVFGTDQISAAQIAVQNATSAILAPLAVVRMPVLSHPIVATDTLASIAAFYNFSVEELGDAIATQQNVFLTQQGGQQVFITIPAVPQQPIGDLVTQVLNTSAANSVAATVSRFSAYALRLPYPAEASATYGMYDLVGQQFVAPDSTGTASFELTSSGVGWVTFAGGDPNLSFTLDSTDLQANYPSTTLTPQWIDQPAALQTYHDQPVRTSLQNVIHWQAAVQPPFAGVSTPAAGAGEPTIWAFPEPLLEDARRNDSTPYKLITLPRAAAFDVPESNVAEYEWATLIPIRLQSITGADPTTQTSYLVSGADQNGRALLLQVWEYLANTSTDESGTQLLLLYPPSGASENPSGLASDAIDFNATFLLKTNLSTETTSNSNFLARTTADPLEGDYYAGLNAPQQFLTLLWEASVTGTGGYVLNYRTTGGAGTPSTAFSQSGDATIWLLILMGSQIKATSPVRRFYSFNNAAVVGDPIDLSAVALYAEASDGSQTTRVATMAAGNAGFDAKMTNPTPPAGTTPTAEQRTQMLFSHLAYAIDGTGNFSASNQGLPAGPARGETSSTWKYEQVFNAAAMATTHPLPVCPALPSNLGDPYAGIAPSSAVTVELWFVDVFGNETTPSSTITNVGIPFLYTDDVIGVLSWPGVAASYLVSTVGARPAITTTIQLRWPTYVPGNGNGYAAAVLAASSHTARYQQAYYQIQQADVTATLTTSLDESSAGVRNAYSVEKYLLTDSVNAAYAFVSTTAQLQQPIVAIGSSGTLAGIGGTWGVDAAALLTENADLQATSVFASSAIVPLLHTFAQGDTLQAIADAAHLTVDALIALGANQSSVIPAAIEIVIPSTTLSTIEGDTLETIAARAGCSIGALADANATVQLEDEVDITLNGVTIATSSDSFTSLVPKFAAQQQTVTVPQIAQASRTIPDLFVPAQQLTVSAKILTAPTTLPILANQISGTSVDALANLNANVPNFFASGTALLLGTTTQTPAAGQTVREFAEEQCQVNVATLGGANGTTALVTGTQLRIPLQAAIPTTGTLYIAYEATSTDTLQSIANLFTAGNTLTLATINEDIAGIINGGQSITVGTQTEPTEDGDSFQSVMNRFAAAGDPITLQQLVTAIDASSAPLIRPGAFFLVPLPQAAASSTPTTAAAQYHVTIDDFANVNAAISPLLTPQVTVTIDQQTETIGAQDTLAKLVARFAAVGVVTTPAAIAAQPNVTLVQGSLFLLPPPAQVVVTPLRQSATFPSAMFAIDVDVTLARSTTLIDPCFAYVPSVQQSKSSLPPAAEGETLSVEQFASAIESAFTNVKVASSRGASATGAEVRQFWLVDFAANGISSVALHGNQATTFAFQPIATTLQSRPADIRPYTSGTGLGDAKVAQFQSVDLETWMRDFLAAVDLVLAPRYAVPLFAIPALAGDANPYSYFDGIAGDKGTIADGLSQNVQPVLQAPPLQSNLTDAQEAARQKMLISLAAGYATDAIVQVPATTTTTLPATPAARLSGQPQAITYVTGATDGFSQLATDYGVSQDAVADVLANVLRIIAQPQTLTYQPPSGPPQTYPTGPDDTLNTIATALHASLNDLVLYLKPQSGFGIFAANVPIPAMAFRATTASDSTLGTVSDFLATDATALAVANENVTGIFSASSLTIGSTTIQITTANNSIAGAAASFTTAGLPMTPALLGRALRDQSGILAASVTLGLMRLVPDYTLSVSKVSLTDSTSTANFLLTTPAARDVRSMWLDLTYAIGELEYDILSVPSVDGYKSSSWLSFVIPMTDSTNTPSTIQSSLGAIDVPIPLRAYPQPPVLLSQSATAAVDPSNVTTAKQWTFGFSYQSEAVAQDTLALSATFNEPPAVSARDVALGDLLFAPLAQFASVWPQLKNDLALLPDAATLTNQTLLHTAYVAIQTMATLVSGVAGAWNQDLLARADTPPPPPLQTFSWEARNTFSEELTPDGPITFYATFILTAGPSGPGPGGSWPNVSWVDEDGIAHALEREAAPSQTQCVYTYAQEIAATRRIAHLLGFPSLDVIAYQAARGGIHITRNESLVFSVSPSSPAPATNPAFLFETPHLTFQDRLIPLLAQNARIDIRSTGNLTTDLTAMFTALLGATDNDYDIQVSVDLGYPVVTSTLGQTLNAYVPALFGPTFAYDGNPSTGTVATLVSALTAWQSANVPTVPTGALWRFNVSVFSSLDTALQRPLIALTNLQWKL